MQRHNSAFLITYGIIENITITDCMTIGVLAFIHFCLKIYSKLVQFCFVFQVLLTLKIVQTTCDMPLNKDEQEKKVCKFVGDVVAFRTAHSLAV